MTNVPLLCNICPKAPEFSDISHLLTHVASKGHVTHRENTKIRALQDASVRERLEAYDRWYEVHQIAKLLSDRMIAKEIKDSCGRARKPPFKPRPTSSTKESKPSRRRRKVPEKISRLPSPVKLEGVIDPQLSNSDLLADLPNGGCWDLTKRPLMEDSISQDKISPTLAVTSHQTSTSPFLNHQQYYSHRAYVPRMSDWQGDLSPQHAHSPYAPSKSPDNAPQTENYNTDGESDYFQTFLRSPTRTTYPDPLEVTGLHSGFSNGSPPTVQIHRSVIQHSPDADSKDDFATEVKSTSQSPILRGVKWPGMSIFDSASLEAQRLRNQRKDETVVEFMEHNSAMVEQLERIYWPDGSLKTQRLITGNVESSPLKEPTPPPKAMKRRRTKVDKPISQILKDISTNAPKPNKKPRSRKAAREVPATEVINLQGLSHKAPATLHPPKFVYPRSTHKGYNPPDDQGLERQMTHGLPKQRRPRAFDVFNDQQENHVDAESALSSKMDERMSSKIAHGHQRKIPANISDHDNHQVPLSSASPFSATHVTKLPQAKSWGSQPRPFPHKSGSELMNEDRENIEPIFKDDGRIDDEGTLTANERITQRYFSVTAHQPPQFFSFMPPGMDFGGLMEPRYHGSTINPLNTYLRQQQCPTHSAQSVVSPQPQDCSGRTFNQGNQFRRPDSRGREHGLEFRGSYR